MSKQDRPDSSLIGDHRRQWRDCKYVYPVISRRAGGLSVGVNLNPDKRCTFSCVYCQIDRSVRRGLSMVDVDVLADELELALRAGADGDLWQEERFAKTSADFRRINDIAFSGDGEPTSFKDFDKAVEAAARVKKKLGLGDVKIIVITNSTLLRSEQVSRSLGVLDANNGQFWVKLDAGTEEYFKRVNRPAKSITLEYVVENITSIAQGRGVVIQTLLQKLDGVKPELREIEAYIARIGDIVKAGGRINLIQVHTIARSPSEAMASSIGDDELDELADIIIAGVGSILVETYYGQDVLPQKRS